MQGERTPKAKRGCKDNEIPSVRPEHVFPEKMSSALEKLKEHTVIVADTGDFECMQDAV